MKRLGLNDTLETERCILRIPQESEAEELWNLITDEITEYLPWEKGDNYEHTLKNIQKTIKKVEEGSGWDTAIYEKKTGKIIGRCGIISINSQVPSCELGYWLPKNNWGKGFVPECVKRILKYIFEESDFEKCSIRFVDGNDSSRRVAEKCGFKSEGFFKSHERLKGELRDIYYYGMTREQYFEQK